MCQIKQNFGWLLTTEADIDSDTSTEAEGGIGSGLDGTACCFGGEEGIGSGSGSASFGGGGIVFSCFCGGFDWNCWLSLKIAFNTSLFSSFFLSSFYVKKCKDNKNKILRIFGLFNTLNPSIMA